jgi:hypothetical protein
MSSLISLGVVLLRDIKRPPWMSHELLPYIVLSASVCIAPQFPGAYAIEWCVGTTDERAVEFDAVGISVDETAFATAWATENFGVTFGWEATFFNVDAALVARQRFFGDDPNMHVCQVCLPERFVDEFLLDAQPPPQVKGYAPIGETGVFSIAQKREGPQSGGRPLGYELLSVELGMISHSWLCNSLERHFAEHAGVIPNQAGFISDREQAESCARRLNEDENSLGAEPGLWIPCLLTEF